MSSYTRSVYCLTACRGVLHTPLTHPRGCSLFCSITQRVDFVSAEELELLWVVEADLCGTFVLGDAALDLDVFADERLCGGLVGEGLLESGCAGFPEDSDELAFDGFGEEDLEHLASFFDGDDAPSDHTGASDLEACFVG